MKTTERSGHRWKRGDGFEVAGFGNQLARPLFRAKHKPDMSEEEAVDLIKEALEVLGSISNLLQPKDVLFRVCCAEERMYVGKCAHRIRIA